MVRTIVYPVKGAAPPTAATPSAPVPDEYLDKLLKYIPGEVVAFYLPAYALAAGQAYWVQGLVVVTAALGGLGYLLARSDPVQPPRRYFYLLATLAFLCWAIGTSGLGTALLGLPVEVTTLIVFGGVFLIPLTDQILVRYGV